MTIYIARHAWTDAHSKRVVLSWTPGIGLNAEGIKQARALAEALKEIELKHIISSPIQRAYETAKIVAESKQMEVEIDSGFSEWYMGIWTGMFFDSVKEQYPKLFKIWRREPHKLMVPGGERIDEVAERMYEGIKKRASQFEDSNTNILIVSHKDPIRAMLTRIIDTDVHKMKRFEIDLASITKLKYNRDHFVIELLNLIPWNSI